MSTPRFKPIKKTFQLGADQYVILSVNHVGGKYVVRERHYKTVKTHTPSYISVKQALEKLEYISAIYSVMAAEAGYPAEYEQKKTGRMIPCPGEAHSNAFIDHCGLCMPGWGEIEELAPIDLEDAKNRRLDVPAPDLDNEQMKDMMAREKAGEVKLVSVRRGNTFYSVYRWTGK